MRPRGGDRELEQMLCAADDVEKSLAKDRVLKESERDAHDGNESILAPLPPTGN